MIRIGKKGEKHFYVKNGEVFDESGKKVTEVPDWVLEEMSKIPAYKPKRGRKKKEKIEEIDSDEPILIQKRGGVISIKERAPKEYLKQVMNE